MEKSKQKAERIQEKKIKIHAGTAYYIFRECFKKIGILKGDEFDDQQWSIKLRKRLEEALPEYNELIDYWLTYHNYLRDKYNILYKIIEDGNPERIIGYEEFRFRPLLTFLEINDYEKLNNSFDLIIRLPEQIVQGSGYPEQVKVPVLYSPKPYSILDVLRNPDRGFIYFYNNGDFVFTGEQSVHIKRGDLKTADIHLMHGIPATSWLKIEYAKDGELCTAYFVEIEEAAKTSGLKDPQKILDYFNRYLPSKSKM